jgi:hypothetical protein
MLYTQIIMLLSDIWLEQSYSTFHEEDNFQTLHTQETHVSEQNLYLATYDMDAYLRKDTTCAAIDATATSTTTKQVTAKVEEHGHKLYIVMILCSVTTDRVWIGNRIYLTLIQFITTLHKSLSHAD